MGLPDHMIDLSFIWKETSIWFLKTDVIDAGRDSRVEVFSSSLTEKSLDNKEEKKRDRTSKTMSER
jgi:hypothetical protein